MDRFRRWEGRHFSNEERLLMYRRVLEGRSYPEIAAEFDSSLNAVYRVFGERRERAVVQRRSALRLSLEDGEEITGGPHVADSPAWFLECAHELSGALSGAER